MEKITTVMLLFSYYNQKTTLFGSIPDSRKQVYALYMAAVFFVTLSGRPFVPRRVHAIVKK
jgi:hypothetical protein